MALAAVGVLLVVGLAIGAFSFQPAPAAAGHPATLTPAATPLPAWAATLADRYRTACGTGPTAAELAALGQDAAVQQVDAAVAQCTAPAGGHKGHGKGKD